MKKLLAMLMLLAMLIPAAMAEDAPVIIDRTGNLTEEYQFSEGTPVLEIVFPRVYSSDCAIVRFGYDVLMIDASTGTAEMTGRIESALASMGVDYIDIAFNTHPHHDHINGFINVADLCPIGRLVLTFEEDFNEKIVKVVKDFTARDIPIEHMGDGDVFYLGAQEDVTIRVLQRNDSGNWTGNNRSAMLHIQYGERTILFTADVENHAQRSFGENPPEGGIKADILKYPHHGQVKLHEPFFEAISPQLSILTGANKVMEGGKNYLDKKHVPYLFSYSGLTRLRTDGHVWVVDYMHEKYPDRGTINPTYR